jgi:hypothetical protein
VRESPSSGHPLSLRKMHPKTQFVY